MASKHFDRGERARARVRRAPGGRPLPGTRMPAALAALVPAFLLIPGAPARAQVEEGRFHGKAFLGGYGSRLVDVGDLDGDGIHDWLAGEPVVNLPPGLPAGRAELRSGATGTLIREHGGPSAGSAYGSGVTGLDDVDGDGVPDYAVGAPLHDVGSAADAGRIELRSGATGSLLRTIDGTIATLYLGQQLAPHDDADGDGRGDLIAWAAGYAFVLSSASGAQIRALDLQFNVASAVVRFDDLDGDGVREVVIGSQRYSGPKIDEGRVYYYSGATGAIVQRHDGASSDDHLGRRIVPTDDHDGDGVRELLVTGRIDPISPKGPNEGRIELRSGATFALLNAWTGKPAEYLGWTIGGGGDWDGDGVSDWFLGAPLAGTFGEVRLHSGATGAQLYAFEGENLPSSLDQSFGSAILPGDFDGDGDGDVLIGAEMWHDAANNFEGIVHRFIGCRALRIAYGTGFPGTLLTPVLAASDEAGLGATIQLTADNSLGAPTSGILVIGLASASVPLRHGATLWVAPLAIEPIAVPVAGWVDTVTIPADPLLCGVDFFLQVFELDPGAAGGLSTTQGLQLRVGFDY